MNSKAVSLGELVSYCDEWLSVGDYSDYCPNGLQVQGRQQVCKIITGVTACEQLLDQAIEQQADAILVHHGYFWKNEPRTVINTRYQRLKKLLSHDISLLAYHLPLDNHPVVGNNRQLAYQLTITPLGQQDLIWYGELIQPLGLTEFGEQVHHHLQRKPLLIQGGNHLIKRLAWCTGGAQYLLEQAAELQVDAYLSGEISEATVHLARELGVHYVAAGHHATERYGVQALGQHLTQHFGIECQFIDVDNPA